MHKYFLILSFFQYSFALMLHEKFECRAIFMPFHLSPSFNHSLFLDIQSVCLLINIFLSSKSLLLVYRCVCAHTHHFFPFHLEFISFFLYPIFPTLYPLLPHFLNSFLLHIIIIIMQVSQSESLTVSSSEALPVRQIHSCTKCKCQYK